MLTRILEPEVMDSAQAASDYDQMDHSEVNRQFVRDLLAEGPLAGDILDLGTGTALIPVELCQQSNDDFRILAVDLSTQMLDLARYNIEVACVIDRVFLAHLDAKDLPHADDAFAVVISNSIIHHIPQPLDAAREAVRVLEPGGLIFVRDLMRPESEELVAELSDRYASSETPEQRKLFEESLRAALTLEETRELVESVGFSPDTVTATSDRHWTWVARKPGVETADKP